MLRRWCGGYFTLSACGFLTLPVYHAPYRISARAFRAEKFTAESVSYYSLCNFKHEFVVHRTTKRIYAVKYEPDVPWDIAECRPNTIYTCRKRTWPWFSCTITFRIKFKAGDRTLTCPNAFEISNTYLKRNISPSRRVSPFRKTLCPRSVLRCAQRVRTLSLWIFTAPFIHVILAISVRCLLHYLSSGYIMRKSLFSFSCASLLPGCDLSVIALTWFRSARSSAS